MLNWHPEVKELLDNQNYQALGNYYEELVENNPDEISNYWHLGLAYLLLGKEEEAQITWFMGLNELSTQEEINEKSRELTAILEQEAQQQEQLENDHNAYLIRQHLRELEYDNLFNLMNLIGLEIKLGCFEVNRLQDWGVIELLKDKNNPQISEDLLIKTLNKVLYIVSEESVNFARACLQNSRNNQLVSEVIIELAKKIVDTKGDIFYAANLVNISLEQNPKDLSLIKTLFWFFANTEHYTEAINFAIEFLNKSDSLSTKMFGTNQLLYLYSTITNENYQECT